MAATLSVTLAASAASAEVTTIPNTLVSVQASAAPVVIEAKRTQGGVGWHEIGRTSFENRSVVVVATSERIRLRNADPVRSTHVEVFATV